MDQLKKRILHWFSKYKYVVLIVCVGIVLMLWPSKKEDFHNTSNNAEQQTSNDDMERRIENIIGFIDKVGEVKVLLTISQGERIHYQLNEDIQSNENSNSTRTDTVIISDSQRQENGLIQQVDPPKYMGAIVVCEGAEDPAVRLSIIDAVSKITGLRTDKISVLKMK